MALAAPGAPFRCAHCGTTLRAEASASVDVRVVGGVAYACPICRRPLFRAVMDEREPVGLCEQCRGLLMARRGFAQTLLARRASARTPSITPPAADPSELQRRIACPRCGDPMITDWYGGAGGIIIDTCPSCDSVWLDGGELQRAIDAPGTDRRA